MKKFSTQLIVLGIIAMGAFLSACAGSEAPAASESEEAKAVTFDFEGQDIAYNIDSVEVSSGQEVTINFDNVGTLEHSWVLVSERVDPVEATEADGLIGAKSGTVAGGESTSFTFTAPGPGTYTFVCTVEGHAEAGMVGDFVVQ